MLIANYHDSHRRRRLLYIGVEDLHLDILPLFHPTVLGNLVPSRYALEVDGGIM